VKPQTAAAIRLEIESLYFWMLDEDVIEEQIVTQRFGQMCAEAASRIYRKMEGKESHAKETDLPLFNRVDPPEMGPADGEDCRRGKLDPQSDIERAAELLRGEDPAREKKRRPRGAPRARPQGEDASCAVKDTASGTDLCTCGHIRAIHHSGPQANGCNSCPCDTFTKADLTIHDQRAAANREGAQTDGTYRIAKGKP